MLKRLAALLCLCLSLGLTSCVSAGAGLQAFSDVIDGYKFLYPIGWVAVDVANGPDVVFHDIIQDTENVSVVINPVTGNKTLKELGSPTEVGYLMQKNAIAPPNSGRSAELVNASERSIGDQLYYLMEYAVNLPDQKRHDLAVVSVFRGKLYTLNASTTERRWPKVQSMFKAMVSSFSVG